MEVVESIERIRERVLQLRAQGRRVGLVPTMGALHAGHLSLIEASRRECTATVATIFVNPAQFGPSEDFSRYPRTIDQDLAELRQAGADLVFVPRSEEIYPPGFSTFVEPSSVAAPWEGSCRPGHFRGVATVVLKLFQILPAHLGFFGQKDFQQALVIRRMVADLNLPIAIRVCPIVREADGLALSSRNRYLSQDDRHRATAISRGLRAARNRFLAGEARAELLRETVLSELRQSGITQPEYVAVADAETLAEVTEATAATVILVAARVGQTRLIDNLVLGDSNDA
ncbi:MAG: pantoate--beta-alanine ligase [Planctomycetes bacterium]|nr:pantoate--beta-alanine ligase [Planctomycetota bacterium]